ncbi:ABC-2 family transporter protein [mine drainage metagenome]|uniref:ABC-2 family transporter protein n=1 Tax=mine drainage metagenome TaxID=410659 RepID=A0A1J5PJ57_9ZZZZ
MKMILIIAGKELRSLFASPMAWVILAMLQLLMGLFFANGVDRYFVAMQGAMAPEQRMGFTAFVVPQMFGIAALVLLTAVPLLTMRLIAEERKSQTLVFLFSAPVSLFEIVFGKFVGLMAFITVVVALMLAMTMSMHVATDLDTAHVLTNALGLWLMAASFSALGIFMSSLTQQPIIAAIISFIALLGLIIIDSFAADPESPLNYLSLMRHFEPLSNGMVSTTDIAYFILFIATFLVLTVRRLDADRLRG